MQILELLKSRKQWDKFLEFKINQQSLSKSELKDLTKFIENEEYIPFVDKLSENIEFSVPLKRLIKKTGTDKKRVVYIFPREENYVLKLFTYLLMRQYDCIFDDNLYSFRINTGVNKALKRLFHISGIQNMYSYKIDISNYFNSIDIDLILKKLKVIFADNTIVYDIFYNLLSNKYVNDNGIIIEEKKGVMAGAPFSGFLANIFLMELDEKMSSLGYVYARYSDDIIVFADTEEKINTAKEIILNAIGEYNLEINPRKEGFSYPGEPWTFLGFKYNNGVVDVSDISVSKLKAKIRRKARSIKRWQIRKKASPEQAVKAFIRAMNRKFFDPEDSNELTWSRWYFPMINTDSALHDIDTYFQSWIRFVYTGKHNNKNYDLRYEMMKELGYISLVHEWYSYKKLSQDRN